MQSRLGAIRRYAFVFPAGVLIWAGIAKLVDATAAAAFVRQVLLLDTGELVVRAVAVGELGLGLAILIIGPAAVVAIASGGVYVAFAVMRVFAERGGNVPTDCGCLGSGFAEGVPHIVWAIGCILLAAMSVASPPPTAFPRDARSDFE
ncbi:MAG: MauE/DoxX family redox-associated membrane protein [Phycisphaerales bacterium]